MGNLLRNKKYFFKLKKSKIMEDEHFAKLKREIEMAEDPDHLDFNGRDLGYKIGKFGVPFCIGAIVLVLTLVVALFVVHFFQKRADKEILTNSRAVSRAATLKRDGGIKVIDGSFDHRQTFGIQESV